jgi:hypothetical protein
LTLGDVLDGMFRLTREHWRAFLLGEGVVMVGSFVLFALVTTVWSRLRAAGHRYWALLGALVLQGLVLLGIALVIMVPFFVLAVATGDSSGFGIWFLGLLLAMIAIVFAAIRMALAVPLIMVEELGPVEAIQRSNALVKGKTLGVFGTLLVAWIIVGVTTLVVQFGSYLIVSVILGSADNIAFDIVGVILGFGILLFTYVMTYALIASALVLVYFDRRVRTEGYDLTEGAGELGARTDPAW